MQHEWRLLVASLVAVGVASLSVLAELRGINQLVYVGLFLVALGLVVRATSAEDGSPHMTRRSARAWVACALLGAAVYYSDSEPTMGVLLLRAGSVIALVEALAWGTGSQRDTARSGADRASP